jgi:hypothetical protein
MNHFQNFVRFSVVIFWLIVIGVGYTMISNFNMLQLGWSTHLFYFTITVMVLYAGFFVSKYLWSLK